jgi:cell division protein FtsW
MPNYSSTQLFNQKLAINDLNQRSRAVAKQGVPSQVKTQTKTDLWLLTTILILIALSVLMVFSTTAFSSKQIYGDATAMTKRRLGHVVLGLASCAFFSRLHPQHLFKYSSQMVGFSVLLLIIVLLPGLGHTAGGAQRWFALGPFRLQPGELSKLALLIFMSSYIHRNMKQMKDFFAGVIVPFGLISFYACLLLMEPDFGSTVVIFAVAIAQLFTTANFRHILFIAISGVSSLGLLVLFEPYRLKRFVSFLDPLREASGSGYQLIQSLIAVGSGGLTGVGLGGGKQKLFYLPAAHTDFIFAVISEELGLIGAIFVVVLFLIVLYRGLKIAAYYSEIPFLCSLAVGCTLLTVVPALLNIGVVLGLLPTKGLVLPLVAYGGTAMLVHLSAVGVLLRLSRLDLRL